MRPICFKAKTKDENKWVLSPSIKDERTVKNGGVYLYLEDAVSDGSWVEIDTETLCEFTGLYDSRGKMVFENDVLSEANFYSGETSFCLITFEDGAFFYVWLPLSGSKKKDYGYPIADFERGIITEYYTVEGNKFDNPEFLRR